MVLFHAIIQIFHLPNKPTVCLYVTSWVASSYGYDNDKSGPIRCALIGAAHGDRSRARRAGRTPPAGVGSTRSALAVTSRRVSTVAPGEFHRSRTRPRSASTPCDDANLPRSAPGMRPCPLHPCLVESWLQCTCRL